MNVKIKMAAYAVLVILVIIFGCLFYSNYQAVTKASAAAAAASSDDTAANPTPAPVAVNTNAVAATNSVVTDTNATNTVTADTNAVAAATNQPPATNATPPPPQKSPKKEAATPPDTGNKRGSMMGYLAAFVVCLIGLGLLIAADVTSYMGSRTVDFLFNDEGEGERDPAYEKAEQVWAQGKHLEAIQMMREFLRDNPRAQYVSLRIAEIYEKDLKNFLAAALEYEEVLKHKLPAERWGWSAIHLCNIYSKMGQQDKTMALLQKIADEYPKTAAAKKARARLGIPEPVAEAPAAPPPEAPAAGVDQRTTGNIDLSKGKINYADAIPKDLEEPEEPQTPPPPKSNLPPGFRPK